MEEYLWLLPGSSLTVCLCSPSTECQPYLMLLCQLRLKEGRVGVARHSGGTVTIHYNLMLDAILEFLCGNQICKKKNGQACHSRNTGTKIGQSARHCEAKLSLVSENIVFSAFSLGLICTQLTGSLEGCGERNDCLQAARTSPSSR